MDFLHVDANALPTLARYLTKNNYGFCDYTPGCQYLWAEFFGYEYCEFEGILYLRGRDTADRSLLVYSPPFGENALATGIETLKRNQKETDGELVLSPVSRDAAEALTKTFGAIAERIEGWADYIYDAEALATLSGHRYNKKRNLTNQFRTLYPDYSYERLDETNADAAFDFFVRWEKTRGVDAEEALAHENRKVKDMLKFPLLGGLIGGVLRVGEAVAALTIGEVIGKTLYTHTERADTSYKGAYQTINAEFAADILKTHGISEINREEDTGDLALRQAKESYFPVRLEEKYRVFFASAE